MNADEHPRFDRHARATLNGLRNAAYHSRARMRGHVSSIVADAKQRMLGVDWDYRDDRINLPVPEGCRVAWWELRRGPLRPGPDGYLPRRKA